MSKIMEDNYKNNSESYVAGGAKATRIRKLRRSEKLGKIIGCIIIKPK